jgi:hypothetical protein
MNAMREFAQSMPPLDHPRGVDRGSPEPRHREDDPLWARIKDFSLDDPGSTLSFSQRLARENGWSRYYASRAIEEYRKFCYLAMSAGHPVTPSDEVDQVWHLHLLYTQSYWDEFCGRTLGRPFHHGPTRGGSEESTKFRGWYEQTLASYQRTFGFPPPSDIWPAAEERFAKAEAFRRVDTASYWLVPKPRLRLPRLR